jgi:hypothetical protein
VLPRPASALVGHVLWLPLAPVLVLLLVMQSAAAALLMSLTSSCQVAG